MSLSEKLINWIESATCQLDQIDKDDVIEKIGEFRESQKIESKDFFQHVSGELLECIGTDGGMVHYFNGEKVYFIDPQECLLTHKYVGK